jgi:hypothetical protein
MELPAPHFIGQGETHSWLRNSRYGNVYALYPTAAEALFCLLRDADCGEMNFYDFCGECGYDSDSRKALEIHDICQKTLIQIRNVLTPAQRAELSALLADY